MKISQDARRKLQMSPLSRTLSSLSHGCWKDTLWVPNKAKTRKLAVWPVAALGPVFIGPAKAQTINCQDISATSFISIAMQDAKSIVASITAGCLGTCMGANITQLPSRLCWTSLCANVTTSYTAGHEALFVESGNNLTFLNCMRDVTDASVQPVAGALAAHNNVFVLVNCLVVFGGGFSAVGIALFLDYCIQRRRGSIAPMEALQLSNMTPEQVR